MTTVDGVLTRIVEAARTRPDGPAVKDLDRSLTYGELVDEVARVAGGLKERGVHEGDRVALWFPNSVDFVVAALASLWAGAAFVPLAYNDPPERLASIVTDCAPAVVIACDDASAAIRSALSVNATSIVTLASLAKGAAVAPAPASRRVAYIIYTSGTTGTPKGVMIGTDAFAAAVAAAARLLGLDTTTRTLCVSPFHFDGSFATLFPTLYCGGAIVLRPRDALLFPRTFVNTVVSEHITHTGFSPSYLRLLLASPDAARLGDSALDAVGIGGEASSVADLESLLAIAPRLRIFNRYGPTEAAIAVSHMLLSPDVLAEGTIPIGVPHPGVSFHLIAEDGSPITAADRVGELYIGGVQLMDGYWGAPELTAQVLRDDVVPGTLVYRTGDLVYRDGRGRYVYVERADRVVKRSGVRISLVEVGEALHTVEHVSAGACVVYDNDGVLGIAAFVLADADLTPLEIRRAMSALLPDTMLPDEIRVVSDLPMTTSNKLDERRLLREAGLSPLPT